VYIGAVVYGSGANRHSHRPYELHPYEVCELVRVALTKHKAPVSQVVSIATKMVRKLNPRLRLIISYADGAQQHHGGIYQAMNWIYTGPTEQSNTQGIRTAGGKVVHKKTWFGKHRSYDLARFNATWTAPRPKHKYLLPLDDAMRKQLQPLSKPYPKRAQSIDSDATATHAVEGGATPTCAL